MARRSSALKWVVVLAAVIVLAVLFLRSVRSTRATPFVVERGDLRGWTLVGQPSGDPLRSWLAVAPPHRLAAALGREIFRRGGESVNYPSRPLVPLLQHHEYDRAFAGAIAPDEIAALARDAGFGSQEWTPRCMGYRRASEPGAPRAVYFVMMDEGPFERFRQQLAERLRLAGRDSSLFDPAAFSPVLMVAARDPDFGRWMPLRADPAADCLAPFEIT